MAAIATDHADLTRRRMFDAWESATAARRAYTQRMVSHLVRMQRWCDEVGVDFEHAAELAMREHLGEVDPESLEAPSPEVTP